jgi:hypothetical protein
MFEKLKAALAVLRAGKAVDNPTAWKQHQVQANQVTVFLAALAMLAKGLGYDLHLDDATLAAVGGGLFALVNWVFTVVSTDKVGALGNATPTTGVAGPAGDAPAGQPRALDPPARGGAAVARAPDPVRPVSRSADPAQDDLRGGP